MSKTGGYWESETFKSQIYTNIVVGMSMREHAVYSLVKNLINAHGVSIDNNPKWIAGWISDMEPSDVQRTIAALVERGELRIEGRGLTLND